jgi:hypothetical protein
MKVKELLTDSSKWIQGDFAKDQNGVSVKDVNKGCKWCLSGAILYCYPNNKHYDAFCKVIDFLYNNYPNAISIVDFNDETGRTFEEIRHVLEETDI